LKYPELTGSLIPFFLKYPKHRFKTPAPSTFIFFWGQTQVQNTSSKYIHIFLGGKHRFKTPVPSTFIFFGGENTGSKHQFQVHPYFLGGKQRLKSVLCDPWF
jgi:hypothetical protein